jgi:hypothetical protein
VVHTPDDTELKSKILTLQTEHDRLFRCAVVPGFRSDGASGDLKSLPTLLAGNIIPFAARTLQDYLLTRALLDTKRITFPWEVSRHGLETASSTVLSWAPIAIQASLSPRLFKLRRGVSERALSSSVY